jgi:hypothetical protein
MIGYVRNFVFKTELRSDFSGRDVTVQTGVVCLSIGKEEACRMGRACVFRNDTRSLP